MGLDQQSPSSTEDARLPIQRLISQGACLVLAVREGEDTLLSLKNNDPLGYPSSMEYILQKAHVDKARRALDKVSARLAALPHRFIAAVDVEGSLEPLRTAMKAHRAELDAFREFCDAYRPPSPREDGEVHPRVDRLLSEVQDAENRVERLAYKVERLQERPEALDFRRRMEVLDAMDREHSAAFSRAMNGVGFGELSAEGQRVAVQQHVLRVVRDTVDWMVEGRGSDRRVDGLFWLEALGQ
ncbi:hypothetical protein R3P38DRAFT_2997995 [Favolaschia claudopus]|uniref:Hemerythrin-like domain-containing protein n=1 Tax=Favolaschia claudopus TaxID=2862362 RepID=A0AAW0ANE9_9AGAR